MEVFVAKDGQRLGPYRAQDIATQVSSGHFSPSDLAWHEGLPDWVPIAQLLPFATDPGPIPPPLPGADSQKRPWIRMWARSIDIMLFTLVCSIGATFIDPEIPTKHEKLAGLVALFAWCFVEPVFLSVFGATPGKALLAVSVRHQNGSRLNYFEALARSVDVWFRGLGCGIPLIALFTQASAYSKLTQHGITSWDANAEAQVLHRTIGWCRWVLLILLFVVLIGIMALGEGTD